MVALCGGTEGTICKLVAQAPDTKDGGGSLPASALHPGNWGGGLDRWLLLVGSVSVRLGEARCRTL